MTNTQAGHVLHASSQGARGLSPGAHSAKLSLTQPLLALLPPSGLISLCHMNCWHPQPISSLLWGSPLGWKAYFPGPIYPTTTQGAGGAGRWAQVSPRPQRPALIQVCSWSHLTQQDRQPWAFGPSLKMRKQTWRSPVTPARGGASSSRPPTPMQGTILTAPGRGEGTG